MPVNCTFILNKRKTSTLSCSGFGDLRAYSGHNEGRDNPEAVALEGLGPLPKGTYYLVDRQSGGVVGPLRDWWSAHGGVPRIARSGSRFGILARATSRLSTA